MITWEEVSQNSYSGVLYRGRLPNVGWLYRWSEPSLDTPTVDAICFVPDVKGELE